MTAVALGLPLGVNVWLVPLMVTGPTLPMDALLALTSVIDREPPLHADGIDAKAMLDTTSSTTVQLIVMPLSEPHELTLALAETTFLGVGLMFAATALPGTASTAAVTATSAGLMRMAG